MKNMKKYGKDDRDLINQILGSVGDKWTIQLISLLDEKPYKFNELKRKISGISGEMLSKRLSFLEKNGLIIRRVHANFPPQVEYEITKFGRSLVIPAQQLVQWVINYRCMFSV